METKEELQKIIEGCVKKKRKYQKRLFDLYYGKMLGVCLRYAKDKDEAKDMVQNGFIKVFKNLKVYNYSGSLEGWIRRIMVNTAMLRKFILKLNKPLKQLANCLPVTELFLTCT